MSASWVSVLPGAGRALLAAGVVVRTSGGEGGFPSWRAPAWAARLWGGWRTLPGRGRGGGLPAAARRLAPTCRDLPDGEAAELVDAVLAAAELGGLAAALAVVKGAAERALPDYPGEAPGEGEAAPEGREPPAGSAPA